LSFAGRKKGGKSWPKVGGGGKAVSHNGGRVEAAKSVIVRDRGEAVARLPASRPNRKKPASPFKGNGCRPRKISERGEGRRDGIPAPKRKKESEHRLLEIVGKKGGAQGGASSSPELPFGKRGLVARSTGRCRGKRSDRQDKEGSKGALFLGRKKEYSSRGLRKTGAPLR